jgi:predicted enzyme related to lactoylglutathione lyase
MTRATIEGLAGVLIWTEAARFPAMARFYRDTLGLTPRSDKADFINFDWSGVRLSVGVHEGVRGETHESLRIMINLTVADIRAAHERLTGAGVAFTRAPAREDWGGWVATFADPDGNVLQLMQLPASREPADRRAGGAR